MPQYEYQGVNAQGKNVKGVIVSDNLAAAKGLLRRDGVFPSSVKETLTAARTSTTSKSLGLLASFKKIPSVELANMTRQLATLVSAHIPLVEALGALIEQVENPTLQAAIAQVKSDVNEGAALSKALSRFPDIFSNLYVSMIASGEASGALDVVMLRLADFLEYQDRLKKKVFGALLYPMIMIGVGFIVIIVIFTFVIPQFETIFREGGATLPLLTQVVLTLSQFFTAHWWLIFALLILIAEGFRRYLNSAAGKRKYDELILKTPIFGDLVRMIAVSRFTKTLSTMLKSGIPLLPSLKVVENVIGNQTIQKAIEQAMTDLTEGANISDPLRRSGQFPPLVTHMVAVGEKTGELESMLEKVAQHYEYQVDSRVQNFTSLLEPIMILVMMGIVLVIVLSVVMPLLELTNVAL